MGDDVIAPEEHLKQLQLEVSLHEDWIKKAKSMGNIMSAAFGLLEISRMLLFLRFDFSFLKSIYYY
jgi:hypothetical protein